MGARLVTSAGVYISRYGARRFVSLRVASRGPPPRSPSRAGPPPLPARPRSFRARYSRAFTRALRYASGCGRYAPLGERSHRGARWLGARFAVARPVPLPLASRCRSFPRFARASVSPRLAARVAALAGASRGCPSGIPSLRLLRLLLFALASYLRSRPRVPLGAPALRSTMRRVSSRPSVVPSLLASGAPALLRAASPMLVVSVGRGFAVLGRLVSGAPMAPLFWVPQWSFNYSESTWGCRPKPHQNTGLRPHKGQALVKRLQFVLKTNLPKTAVFVKITSRPQMLKQNKPDFAV